MNTCCPRVPIPGVEELGLTDYALRRFALAGNPAAWIARIEEIAQAGATKLWLNAEGAVSTDSFITCDCSASRSCLDSSKSCPTRARKRCRWSRK